MNAIPPVQPASSTSSPQPEPVKLTAGVKVRTGARSGGLRLNHNQTQA